MNDYTPSDYSKFIESLKVTKEGLEEMHGIPFNYPMHEVITEDVEPWQLQEYLIARLKSAESNAKPSDLAEQVKGFMRAGMEAATLTPQGFTIGTFYRSGDYEDFRRLSEATKVKP